jgi:hypothetical protein
MKGLKHRSVGHLATLGALSGLITLAVVVANLSSTWLALGPLILAAVDLVVFSRSRDQSVTRVTAIAGGPLRETSERIILTEEQAERVRSAEFLAAREPATYIEACAAGASTE